MSVGSIPKKNLRMSETPYYPLFIDLRQRPVLVVGAGDMALEKVNGLVASGAKVSLLARQIHGELQTLVETKQVQWIPEEYVDQDLSCYFLVLALSNDAAYNQKVYRASRHQFQLAAAIDDLEHCNFITPAISRAGSIQVAVSSSGTSPALAKRLRDTITQQVLRPEVGILAAYLGSWRPIVKSEIRTYQSRKAFWESILESSLPHLLVEQNKQAADLLMQEKLSEAAHIEGQKNG